MFNIGEYSTATTTTVVSEEEDDDDIGLNDEFHHHHFLLPVFQSIHIATFIILITLLILVPSICFTVSHHRTENLLKKQD
jgi:hypothetical protein